MSPLLRLGDENLLLSLLMLVYQALDVFVQKNSLRCLDVSGLCETGGALSES
jgi:hypothetical protein